MKIEHYVKPTSLDEAYETLVSHKENAILGGGAWLKLTNKSIATLIDVSDLGLDTITETEKVIRIGAQTTLHQLEVSPIIQKYADGILANAAKSIMGMNVRNIATIGGSIIGKYSFSDLITPLLSLGAVLVFHHQQPLLIEDYISLRHQEKDLLLAIELPKKQWKGYFYNVKKTALDFAVLNVAITKADDVTIAIGARPGGAILAKGAMTFLNQKEDIALADVEAAARIAQAEIHVSDNFRAQKEYRELLVHVYVQRGLKEVFGL